MTQLNLFPFRPTFDNDGNLVSMTAPVGDRASSARNYLWVVEKQDEKGNWYPLRLVMAARSRARRIAKSHRLAGSEVRVVPYKACVDSKGRHNRQVVRERTS